MSSTTIKTTTASNRRTAPYQGYNPVPTNSASMDNPAMSGTAIKSGAIVATQPEPLAVASNIEDGDQSSVEGVGLPSTHSSQQLMPPSDNNSDRLAGGATMDGRSSRSGISRKEWFTVGVLCFVNLINYMDRFTIAGVLTDIQDDFKIGDDDGGLLQTAFVLSYMVCAPLFGYLGDRYSRRWIMAVGVLLWSTTTLLGSFMNSFGWFITFRALVGIGEASYSTIAPTLISDLFVGNMRSRMLALFYFAIPVGSGFGYIVGSETARLAENWRWALRVTPLLGIVAVVLIMLIKDPVRGESEGSHNLATTTYVEDIKDLSKNRSFMLSTAGFTCVAFVAGALAWWGPKFIFLGLRMQSGNENLTLNDVAFAFGFLTMTAGIIGVPLGSFLSQFLNKRYPSIDPLLCAFGLFTSVPLLAGAMIIVSKNTIATYTLIFFGQLAINLNWAIVADMLLYVVVPTRRSTAEAFQILISHALGDAGSPYLVGVLSEAIKKHLRTTVHKSSEFIGNQFESLSLTLETAQLNATMASLTTTDSAMPETLKAFTDQDTNLVKFEALQYALFSTSFVEVLGGVFFLITAAFILKDKHKASQAIRDGHQAVPVNIEEIS